MLFSSFSLNLVSRTGFETPRGIFRASSFVFRGYSPRVLEVPVAYLKVSQHVLGSSRRSKGYPQLIWRCLQHVLLSPCYVGVSSALQRSRDFDEARSVFSGVGVLRQVSRQKHIKFQLRLLLVFGVACGGFFARCFGCLRIGCSQKSSGFLERVSTVGLESLWKKKFVEKRMFVCGAYGKSGLAVETGCETLI